MWSIASPPRRGAWLCPLGSILALVGFFLPYFNFPMGSALWSKNLVESFAVVADSMATQPDMIAWGIGAVLLLLLLSTVVLACLMFFFQALRQKSLSISMRLVPLTLLYYLVVTQIIYLSVWVGVGLSDGTPSLIDVLSCAGIGAWLTLAGLVLALIGNILMKRQESMADD